MSKQLEIHKVTIKTKWFGGLCPVQGEGTVTCERRRYCWYFRSRGRQWTLDLKRGRYESQIARGDVQTWPNAGYIFEDICKQLVDNCLKSYFFSYRVVVK